MRAARFHEYAGAENPAIERAPDPRAGPGEIRLYGPGLARRLTGLAPGGVDVVLDTAGSGPLDDLVAIAGDPARVATVADHTGGPRLGAHVVDAENDPGLLAAAADLGRRALRTPRVELAFPLERIADAHAYAERGRTRGKIVVRI
ncbi:zinc-binding dehydrogenase [Actinomadura sp. DSM 109109]|nr:zinc-binding dehydrogenase [Actinomadura lepetitiana]